MKVEAASLAGASLPKTETPADTVDAGRKKAAGRPVDVNGTAGQGQSRTTRGNSRQDQGTDRGRRLQRAF